MGEENTKELTREERTILAASIAKKLEDATRDDKYPGDAQFKALELVATLLFPGRAAQLVLH